MSPEPLKDPLKDLLLTDEETSIVVPARDLAFTVEVMARIERQQLRENLKVLDFTLTNDEMNAISALARGVRIVNPPHGPTWD